VARALDVLETTLSSLLLLSVEQAIELLFTPRRRGAQ